MLERNFSYRKKNEFLSFVMMVLSLVFLNSCMPTATAPNIETGGTTTNDPTNAAAYVDPQFPMAGIFVQEGATQTLSQFSLALNFNDSFLLRGSALSQFLRTVPNTTRFCMVSKYTYRPGRDKFLIMSAKPKSYTDLVKKTTEFFLQVEPANDLANQNDCLTYNLTSSIFVGATSPTPYFSLTQVCSECTSAATSQGFKLYYTNGQPVPNLNLSTLALTIAGATSNTGNVCVESTACSARGYNCCLDGQCVNDGALRPGANDAIGFSQAQLDVASNPNRFVLYPQFYFVCASRPEEDGQEDNQNPADPDYEARIRIMELTQLHQCLNPVDGEFSYCTIKFSQASNNIKSNTPFSSAILNYVEDVNFSNMNPYLGVGNYANNIVKIFYGGQSLYDFTTNKNLAAADGFFVTTGNDDIKTAQSVRITKLLPEDAQDDNLYLTFKIDGSCQKLSTNLARCSKTYVHDYQDGNTSTKYHDDSKTYYLPEYADTSVNSNIIVKISGIVIPEDPSTWSKIHNPKSDDPLLSWPNGIQFSASYPLYTNQTVEISYYVKSYVSNLTMAKTAAQNVVNSMCICGTNGSCNLNPILDSAGNISNYECSYPGSAPTTPPANQTAYVSNKNVPHRFYDTEGVAYDESFGTRIQEGTEFFYKSNNILKPSNLDEFTGYTGFNEIYGSFTSTSPTSAKPAKMLKVKKDTVYDLFTNSGVFSTCLTCGADYYSSIKKIFPPNYTGMGGGYSPDNFDSARISNTGTYRSDDLLYGRACFVPATMIPWTHGAAASVKTQRRNRLAAQHFLFANGYNRDWYGFDYGSLIGSFDGVTWFSIGNQRRIKATSNKLFLAVNAYYGDLSVDSNFNITVSETTSYSGDMPDHDTETDGAECQKSHLCSTDDDCFRQVGFEYTCQNISSLSTNWPVSDAVGSETIGSVNKTLASIVGGTNGQAKRCVYRGKGAPCYPNLNALGTTFNNSSLPGTLTCNTNNMCQPFSTGAKDRFNDRISRFANTPVAQNAASAAPTPSDTSGLAARILGRPFDYNGKKLIPSPSTSGLNANSVTAICIPGKNITASAKTYDLNMVPPGVQAGSSDKIFGIGPTMSGLQNSKYLNSCPATDSLGISIQQYDLNLGDAGTINLLTTTQNLSTNLLDLSPIVGQNIFNGVGDSQITAIGYQRNSCLRAPGASCFSDMDCAPSEFIASKVKTANVSGVLNPAEEKYWEEELICGNPNFKYSAAGVLNTASFNVKNNVCCRDFGKSFSVFTQSETSPHHWCDTTSPGNEFVKVAGINTNISSYNRYSRVHTGYDKMTCKIAEVTSTKSFALSLKSPTTSTRYTQAQSQFKTLDTINQRTCCTKNWVRQFATTNGGGNLWTPSKLQTINKANFRSLNWLPTNSSDANNPIPYECTNLGFSDPSCEIRNFTNTETETYLKFFGALELVGIPQVAIQSENFVTKINNNEDYCNASGVCSGTAGGPGGGLPIDGTVMLLGGVGSLGTTVTEDFTDSSSRRLFSAANYNALQPQLRKVFSENEFNCCIPSGQQVPDTTTPGQCCTGYLANSGSNNTLRCCMQDFTDLTVYLSRYVSSEGRGLPDAAYDPDTGYIKDVEAVKALAAQKNLCCSGEFATGVAIRKLPIPITGNLYLNQPEAFTRRFVYLDSAVDNNPTTKAMGQIFDAGVRWNNHLYCVPKGFAAQIPAEN